MKRIGIAGILALAVPLVRANPFTVNGSTTFIVTDGGSVGVSTNSPSGLFMVGSGTMVVTQSGNVGIGTTNPSSALEIKSLGANLSGSLYYNLYQHNAGSTIGGYLGYDATNLVGAIGSSGGASNGLIFTTGGSFTERMRIDGSGNVGIGTASPSTNLDIQNSVADVTLRIKSTAGGAQNAILYLRPTGARTAQIATIATTDLIIGEAASDPGVITSTHIYVQNTTGLVGIDTTLPVSTLTVNGTASKIGGGSWDNFSDSRLKDISGPYTHGLDEVMQLQPIRFRYKANNPIGIVDGKEEVGFEAEAVQKIIPEAVSSVEVSKFVEANGAVGKKRKVNLGSYLMFHADPIYWAMLNAIKEQQNAILNQQKKIDQLEAQVQTMQRARQ